MHPRGQRLRQLHQAFDNGESEHSHREPQALPVRLLNGAPGIARNTAAKRDLQMILRGSTSYEDRKTYSSVDGMLGSHGRLPDSDRRRSAEEGRGFHLAAVHDVPDDLREKTWKLHAGLLLLRSLHLPHTLSRHKRDPGAGELVLRPHGPMLSLPPLSSSRHRIGPAIMPAFFVQCSMRPWLNSKFGDPGRGRGRELHVDMVVTQS